MRRELLRTPSSNAFVDASAVTVTLGAAAVCWVIALPRLRR
jgi:hypothetical protein